MISNKNSIFASLNMRKILNFLIVMAFVPTNAFASQGQTDHYAVFGSPNLYAVKQEKGYKVYDRREQKYISEQIYDTICGHYAYSGCENMVVVVRSYGKYGLIDALNGKEILIPARSPITDFTDDVYAPEPLVWILDGKCETLTSVPIHSETLQGHPGALKPVIYYYIWHDEAQETQVYRIGFSNEEGIEVIPPIYDNVFPFIDGMAIVEKNLRAGVINTSGELIVPCEYDLITLTDGLLSVYKLIYPDQNPKGTFLKNPDGIKWIPAYKGIIDRNGRIIIPCEYHNIDYLQHTTTDSTGYVRQFLVRKKISDEIYLCGLMDMDGNEIFPIKYAGINEDNFGRYLLWSSPEELAGMADNDRNMIVPMIYERVYSSEDPEYIIVERDGKCGMVSPRNRVWVRPDKFEAISLVQAHCKTFFFAMTDGKWGRITTDGKILLACKYEHIEPYQEDDDNSMVVLLDGQWMRIDSKGNVMERYEKYPYEIEFIVEPPNYY